MKKLMDFLFAKCIKINNQQTYKLLQQALLDFKNLKNKNIAILGVTYKPGTDDLRNSLSVKNIKRLLKLGSKISVYDPMGLEHAQKIFKNKITYCKTIDECVKNKDLVMIMTEWDEIKKYNIENYKQLMKTPIIYDGRNCYSLNEIKKYAVYYYSIGRETCNTFKH